MLTEEEAKTKWCPFSRPVFPRVEDCGYQTGNRNSVPSGESQIMEQSSCIGSACMAWRFEPADAFSERQEAYEDSINIGGINKRKEPLPHGYCGLAGRPE